MNRNEPELFATICHGGPLDGLVATLPVGEKEMTHFQIGGGACELLPGDCLLASDGDIEEHRYHLFSFLKTWSTGYLWRYRFWVHEPYLPLTPEAIESIVMAIHPGGCHVERSFVAKLKQPPSPLFRYGLITLSNN